MYSGGTARLMKTAYKIELLKPSKKQSYLRLFLLNGFIDTI